MNRQAVAVLRELGIGLHAAFMVNPDFTEEDFARVRQAVTAVGALETSFTVFSPPPGTELWRKHRAEFACPDPLGCYDGMHTLLPTRLPLKTFYREYASLWLCASRTSPLLRNGWKMSFKDLLRFFYSGFRFGYSVQHIYQDYGRPNKGQQKDGTACSGRKMGAER